MSLKLYYLLASPPCRASILTLKALNIAHELISVNIFEGEQFTPAFLKKNPLHTLPTLEDGEFCLSDSHAINAYLVNKFSDGSNMYPKDFQKRAIIDQRLYFDNGIIFPNIRRVTRAIKAKKLSAPTSEVQNSYEEPYAFIEKFLSETKYIAGENLTIADFSFVTSLTTMNTVVPINEKFPLTKEYLNVCKSSIPNYEEVNENGVKEYINNLKSLGFVFPN